MTNCGILRIFLKKRRAYNNNQICLVEKFFQVIKKVFTLNLFLIFCISYLQGRAMGQCPHPKYATNHKPVSNKVDEFFIKNNYNRSNPPGP